MSRSVELSDSVYAALEAAASASGTTPAEWIAARLPPPMSELQPGCEGQPPRTLADDFAGRVGLFSSGETNLAERVSELFTEGMVEKHRAGHL